MNENMIESQGEIYEDQEISQADIGDADNAAEGEDPSEEGYLENEDVADTENPEYDLSLDILELKNQFPETSGEGSQGEIVNSEKYRRFREIGLTPAEAYMACGGGRAKERLRPTSPLSVKRRDDGIPQRQLRMARELFSEMSDTEIQALYRRVTK